MLYMYWKNLLGRCDWGGQRRLPCVAGDWMARVTYVENARWGNCRRFMWNMKKSEGRSCRARLPTLSISVLILWKCSMEGVIWSGFCLEKKKITDCRVKTGRVQLGIKERPLGSYYNHLGERQGGLNQGRYSREEKGTNLKSTRRIKESP